jgi:hypothetical protein
MAMCPGADLRAASLLVTWNGNTEKDLAGYRVYYGTAGDALSTVVDVRTTSLTISNVLTGVSYYVAVTAYDTSGNESTRSPVLGVYVPASGTSSQDTSGSGQSPDPASSVSWTDSQQDLNGASSGNASDSGDDAAIWKPVVVSPEDGAEDVGLTPVLQADPPSGAYGLVEWEISSGSGDLVLDAVTGVTNDGFTVPDLVLDAGATYYCRTRFMDGHGTATGWSDPVAFSTVSMDPSDLNMNGIPDDQEPDPAEVFDLDGDGVADPVQRGMKTIVTLAGQEPLSLKASTGCRGITVLKAIDPDTMGGSGSRPASLPIGLIDFKLEVEQPGGIAEVTVYLMQPAPEGSRWYTYDRRAGWKEYPHATFSRDRTSVTLQMKDGDPDYGDCDGAANGVIVDPGGIGAESDAGSESSSSGGSGGGCFISSSNSSGDGGYKVMRAALLGILSLLVCALASGILFPARPKAR